MSNAGRNVISLTKYQTPGPGSYDSNEKLKNGVKFSLSKRKEMSKTSIEPGPGAYNTNSITMKQNPSFTMRPSDAKLKNSLNRYKESIPGPGTYESSFERRNRKAKSICGFGSSSRTNVAPKEANNTPGPGAYKLPSRVAELPPYENNIKASEFKYT